MSFCRFCKVKLRYLSTERGNCEVFTSSFDLWDELFFHLLCVPAWKLIILNQFSYLFASWYQICIEGLLEIAVIRWLPFTFEISDTEINR